VVGEEEEEEEEEGGGAYKHSAYKHSAPPVASRPPRDGRRGAAASWRDIDFSQEVEQVTEEGEEGEEDEEGFEEDYPEGEGVQEYQGQGAGAYGRGQHDVWNQGVPAYNGYGQDRDEYGEGQEGREYGAGAERGGLSRGSGGGEGEEEEEEGEEPYRQVPARGL